MKHWSARAALVGGAVTTVIMAGAGIAQADDTWLILSDRDGRQIGHMVHLDPDPDRFRICDDQRDGYGVTGTVYRWNGVGQTGYWQSLESATDGSDAGCDTISVSITNYLHYRMVLCWDGPGDICTRVNFDE
ncbi:hypothetical protein [Thermomonospora umbrina]|uniref:Secreted protein n=1 Tax=Thermomonospora umbrina TaxID=111806 RepID=A0A3D9SFR4_9ACTN|nr:hypothetical protein [Thermomonospora umbrina]REE94742.1 hypothetical protein DFJ69_0096 [Thermomonospora umbrina]